jgi:two-component system nitrate/nitrite response regulator NarL
MAPSVLVLDDSRASRQFLCRVARVSYPEAADIAEADDLGAARRLLGMPGQGGPEAAGVGRGAGSFGLVLLEPAMAGGAGSEFLAELALQGVRKVVATVHGDDEHVRAAFRCRVDGYLLKNDPQDIWVDALRRLPSGQPALSPAIARRLMECFGVGPVDGLDHAQRSGTLPPPSDDLGPLTPRENEVLTYLSKGFTIREISDLLGIRWFTVNDHIKAIYRKLDVSSRAEAAVLAAKRGLV